jgi:hypothetical protein
MWRLWSIRYTLRICKSPTFLFPRLNCSERTTIRERRGSPCKSDGSTVRGIEKLLANALRTLAKVYLCQRELLWKKCCGNRCKVAYFCELNQFRELLKLLVLIMGRLLLCLYISSSWTIASPIEAERPQNCQQSTGTHLETERSNRRFGIRYAPEAVVCSLTFRRLLAASKSALSHRHSHSLRHTSTFLVRQTKTATWSRSGCRCDRMWSCPGRLSHSLAVTIQFWNSAYRWQDHAPLIRSVLLYVLSLFLADSSQDATKIRYVLMCCSSCACYIVCPPRSSFYIQWVPTTVVVEHT